MDTMYIALSFMVLSASSLVWIGAKRSVNFAAQGKSEKMTSNDAMKFPLTGSCVLFGLYILIKFVPKDILTMLLSVYLTMISIACLAAYLRPIIGANVLIGTSCVAVGCAFFYFKHWVLNNILAFAICVVGIEAMQLKAYLTSAILLVGLFFYDIFWVFGTDVMVTVAKNIEGPIKLLFPKDVFGDHKEKSLLGLGDIVIPGFFISQMLRFSLILYLRQRGATKGKPTNEISLLPIATEFSMFSFAQCSYFHVAFVAYILSLVNTMFVMMYFRAAQPALLYIVPWLLISTFLLAVVRGEVKTLFGFEEHDVIPEDEEDAERKKAEEEAAANTGFFKALKDAIVFSALFIFGLDEETLNEKKKLKKTAAGGDSKTASSAPPSGPKRMASNAQLKKQN